MTASHFLIHGRLYEEQRHKLHRKVGIMGMNIPMLLRDQNSKGHIGIRRGNSKVCLLELRSEIYMDVDCRRNLVHETSFKYRQGDRADAIVAII